MQSFKHRMNFSKREQHAIVFLIFVMIILLVLNIFPEIIITSNQGLLHNLDSIAAVRGKEKNGSSTNQSEDNFDIANPDAEAAAIKLHPFPFDPNKLSAEQWKAIGLTDRQILNILNYEKKGGKFFKKNDLQKIYSITLPEFKVLEPFIEIPITDAERGKKVDVTLQDSTRDNHESPVQQAVFALNTIDSVQLTEIQHIGPWFAHRILQYRHALGGYVTLLQLAEVYGMDSVRYKRISRCFTLDTSHIQLLAINRLTFKELIRHPYMNYNLTKAIINRREHHGFVANWSEVVGLNANDSLTILRLKPYLGYK